MLLLYIMALHYHKLNYNIFCNFYVNLKVAIMTYLSFARLVVEGVVVADAKLSTDTEGLVGTLISVHPQSFSIRVNLV